MIKVPLIAVLVYLFAETKSSQPKPDWPKVPDAEGVKIPKWPVTCKDKTLTLMGKEMKLPLIDIRKDYAKQVQKTSGYLDDSGYFSVNWAAMFNNSTLANCKIQNVKLQYGISKYEYDNSLKGCCPAKTFHDKGSAISYYFEDKCRKCIEKLKVHETLINTQFHATKPIKIRLCGFDDLILISLFFYGNEEEATFRNHGNNGDDGFVFYPVQIRGTLKACKEVPALRAKEAKPWKYSPLKLPFPPDYLGMDPTRCHISFNTKFWKQKISDNSDYMDPNNPNLFTINWDKMLGVYELGLNQTADFSTCVNSAILYYDFPSINLRKMADCCPWANRRFAHLDMNMFGQIGPTPDKYTCSCFKETQHSLKTMTVFPKFDGVQPFRIELCDPDPVVLIISVLMGRLDEYAPMNSPITNNIGMMNQRIHFKNVRPCK